MREGVVMLKRFLSKILVAVFCFSMFGAIAAAEVKFDTAAPGAENTAPKKKLALMFVNNAKTTYDAELSGMIADNFDKMLKPKYQVVTGNKYVELLNKAGIQPRGNGQGKRSKPLFVLDLYFQECAELGYSS